MTHSLSPCLTARILLPLPFSKLYTYRIPESLEKDALPGCFVLVPFGPRTCLGVIWKKEDATEDSKTTLPITNLKSIEHVFRLPPLSSEAMAFVEKVSAYTFSPLGAVLKLGLLPLGNFKRLEREKKKGFPAVENEKIITTPTKMLTLSQEQTEAYKSLATFAKKGFAVSLLEGVTGSGKTEVYFEMIKDILRQKKQALVLLPEISLSQNIFERFESRFQNYNVRLWNSALTPKIRRTTWNNVANGMCDVIVGARSALFLNYKKLGLIVVDEEHDSAFKQEDGVLYNARDMATFRAQLGRFPIILSSATPSLETRAKAQSGKYLYVSLQKRFAEQPMPLIKLVDMRRERIEKTKFLSPLLVNELRKNLERGSQSLLFVNRRGYAPLLLCFACGYRLGCPHCTSWLVEHRLKKIVMCHYCGFTRPSPTACPSCENPDALVSYGPGIERITQETEALFPQARISTLSSDHIESSEKIREELARIEQGAVDIALGTQMLAKGHNFPHLTLVGVVDADSALAREDIRGPERCVQLLQQVAGRAGRIKGQGHVFIQTFAPHNPAMQALASNDILAFCNWELQERKKALLPPFSRLAALIVSARNAERVSAFSKYMKSLAPQPPSGIEVLGPVLAPLARLRKDTRFRFLVKAQNSITLNHFLHSWLKKLETPSSIRVAVDIDPYQFY